MSYKYTHKSNVKVVAFCIQLSITRKKYIYIEDVICVGRGYFAAKAHLYKSLSVGLFAKLNFISSTHDITYNAVI